MSDFTQTMKDWRRMCKFYMCKFHSATFETCCKGCRLDGLVPQNCGAICDDEFADVVDWEELEKRIDAWAAEHPEPKYPTWKEWLEERRVVVHFDSVDEKGKKVKWELTNAANYPIPADIAEKLGIDPEEHFAGAGKKEG